jgi:hypothetical protein
VAGIDAHEERGWLDAGVEAHHAHATRAVERTPAGFARAVHRVRWLLLPPRITISALICEIFLRAAPPCRQLRSEISRGLIPTRHVA